MPAMFRYLDHWATVALAVAQNYSVSIVWQFGKRVPAQELSSSLDGGLESRAMEPDEIMHINPGRESKFEKSDEHETFELNGKLSNAT
ncbi:hypothetical protein TNCV_181271 [Trichonephila clavipes]|nr:hypothetical protein TNCV_181271 [Trichonephila clavipes]